MIKQYRLHVQRYTKRVGTTSGNTRNDFTASLRSRHRRPTSSGHAAVQFIASADLWPYVQWLQSVTQSRPESGDLYSLRRDAGARLYIDVADL